jgi:hypothetical protein
MHDDGLDSALVLPKILLEQAAENPLRSQAYKRVPVGRARFCINKVNGDYSKVLLAGSQVSRRNVLEPSVTLLNSDAPIGWLCHRWSDP